MISAQAPGKLYIAGEYAVVEPGYAAIIVALNQFVTVSVEASQDYGSIVSKQYQENSIFWRRQGTEMVFDNRDNPFHYILSAIRLTEEYAQALDVPLKLYHLRINSDLDSPDGKKYGLGSSAAVTVATIKALAKFYQLPMTQDRLFKLAAIAHFDIQGNGSLGDIAASVYGGWIAYQAFDREWLATARHALSLPQLLAAEWPNLRVELLKPPAGLELLIGWTGSPASTSHLVDKISAFKLTQQAAYQAFLQASRDCLSRLIDGFHAQNLQQIQAEIAVNRALLAKLAQQSGVQIETPALKDLCDIAVAHGGAAKSSGAGGGDCGIAVVAGDHDLTDLLAQWRQHHIEPLALNVHTVVE